jgi:hypothetical protein
MRIVLRYQDLHSDPQHTSNVPEHDRAPFPHAILDLRNICLRHADSLGDCLLCHV